MQDRFVIGDHVLSQRISEGMLVVDTRTLTYIELDRVGADMWEATTARDCLEEAAVSLQEVYDVDPVQLRTDLTRMVEHWVQLGLGDISATVPASVPGPDSDSMVSLPTLLPQDLYLDLMVKTLCGLTAGTVPNLGSRLAGFDVPSDDPAVFTLIGAARLNNIRALVRRALDDDIPGDLMECGVWRGGASIFMRAVLAAEQVHDRTVWVADSFEGLPEVTELGHPLDQQWASYAGAIRVSEQQVRANFELFSLLDGQVRFVPGWFEESLPGLHVDRLALLRLDADLYESTMTALTHLYPKVTPGGFVIIDDWNFASCRQAVRDYLGSQNISVELHPIDWAGVWWRKPL